MDQRFKFIQNPVEQISDIKDYLMRIVANWKWFVLSLIIALAIAYYKNISSEKIYGLKTTILVKEKQNPLFSSGTNIAFNWGGVSDKVESIKKTLTSRTHNEKVVKKLHYYIEYLKEGKFRDEDVYGEVPFTLALQTNQYQLLDTKIAITIKSNETFEVSVNFQEGENYSLVNYKDQSKTSFTPSSSTFSKEFSSEEYINIPFLKAQLIASNNIESYIGQTFFVKLISIDKATSNYLHIRAVDLTGTSLVEISLTGSNKSRIVDYLNETVIVLAADELEQKTNYARSTKAFIDAQFKNTSDSLKIIEDNIGSFKTQNNIYNLSAEGGEIFSQTKELDGLLQEFRNRLSYLQNLENYIITNSNYDKIPAPAVINIEDQTIAGLIGQLTELSVENQKLQKEVTQNHPSLKLSEDALNTTRNVLLEKLESLKNTTEININNIEQRLNSYNSKLNKLPTKEQQLLNYERKYNLTESNYVFLMQKRYEADIAIAASVSDISVLDVAKDTGQGFISPRVSFNYMVAMLMGLVLPLFVIIAKEVLDDKIQNADEIEKITPIPVLGVIGRSKASGNLAVFLKPTSSIAESFRALRSNIQFLFKRETRNKSKVILTTSSVGGEGKTFVSMNLATVFALGGKKTILLGLDLRKPKIFDDFNYNNEKGFVNYLIGDDSIEDIIFKTHISNLDIITSGPIPPNPSELLLNPATSELIESLKQQYDYIILDTPPIGLVSDALELIKYSDATVYVVRQDYTKKGMFKMINTKYKKGEISGLSIVLNDFKVKTKYGYGYGYGYGKYSSGYFEKENSSFIKRIFSRK